MTDIAAATAPTMAPLLVDAKGAAELLGIGRSHFLALYSAGQIGPVSIRLGRSVRFRADELAAWCAAHCPARDQWEMLKGASK